MTMMTMTIMFLVLLLAVFAAGLTEADVELADERAPVARKLARQACDAWRQSLLNQTLTGIEGLFGSSVANVRLAHGLRLAVNMTRCPVTEHDVLYDVTTTLCSPKYGFLVRCLLPKSLADDGSLVVITKVPASKKEKEDWGKCGCLASDAEAAQADVVAAAAVPANSTNQQ